MTSAATRKNIPKTPFLATEIKAAAGKESSPALIVAMNNVASLPSNVLITLSVSARGISRVRKRSLPQDKTVHKSALKSRRGFVKDSVSDIQHRISVPDGLGSSTNGAVTCNRRQLPTEAQSLLPSLEDPLHDQQQRSARAT